MLNQKRVMNRSRVWFCHAVVSITRNSDTQSGFKVMPCPKLVLVMNTVDMINCRVHFFFPDPKAEVGGGYSIHFLGMVVWGMCVKKTDPCISHFTFLSFLNPKLCIFSSLWLTYLSV